MQTQKRQGAVWFRRVPVLEEKDVQVCRLFFRFEAQTALRKGSHRFHVRCVAMAFSDISSRRRSNEPERNGNGQPDEQGQFQ
jgi:hypothetical protein